MRLKIGLFDSGVGGLTVLFQLVKRGVGSEYLYLADTVHAPFGTKDVEEVKNIALDCINFLFEKGAEVVISACNTAQAALLKLRAQPEKNFFGILDFDLPTNLGKVAVLTTEATEKSGVYLEKMRSTGLEPLQRSCQELVTAIEACVEDEEIEHIVERAVQPLRGLGIETIILGCTHFPLVKHVFENLSGGMLVIDPAELLVKKLEKILPRNEAGEVHVKFYVTRDAQSFTRKLQRYGVDFPYTVEEFSWGGVGA